MGKAFAVVGASGTLGREVLQALAEAGVKAADVAALASDRSAGTGLTYGDDDEIVTQELGAHDFSTTKVTIFCTAPAVGWGLDTRRDGA